MVINQNSLEQNHAVASSDEFSSELPVLPPLLPRMTVDRQGLVPPSKEASAINLPIKQTLRAGTQRK